MLRLVISIVPSIFKRYQSYSSNEYRAAKFRVYCIINSKQYFVVFLNIQVGYLNILQLMKRFHLISELIYAG
jgi:hypothetical protein